MSSLLLQRERVLQARSAASTSFPDSFYPSLVHQLHKLIFAEAAEEEQSDGATERGPHDTDRWRGGDSSSEEGWVRISHDAASVGSELHSENTF